jgi:hypothetical protein
MKLLLSYNYSKYKPTGHYCELLEQKNLTPDQIKINKRDSPAQSARCFDTIVLDCSQWGSVNHHFSFSETHFYLNRAAATGFQLSVNQAFTFKSLLQNGCSTILITAKTF